MPKMIFREDKYVDGEVFARKGEAVEVAERSVERWLKRGGQLIEEKEVLKDVKKDEQPAPVVQTRGPGRPKKSI